MNEKLLPLGSIVLLKEGLQKLVVVGRGAIYNDQITGEEKIADYMGAIYPTGVNPESTIFFQDEDVDKVVFEGYIDDDENRFQDIYSKWRGSVKLDKIVEDAGSVEEDGEIEVEKTSNPYGF
ncbi:DUF4176 domain-containing protein [Weissella muntiaci]|uniref:DUF4176 domain-containing protein n=1 Tax=Weissella muntiaci TaxID=2508881 RepID=A0A6C2C5D1_9LACO|nr:DUF4176 domain-containing protein [Weissella muntiaci]TYC49057.1 DUF4176 domain-containing protein [Weissella muntiaci]